MTVESGHIISIHFTGDRRSVMAITVDEPKEFFEFGQESLLIGPSYSDDGGIRLGGFFPSEWEEVTPGASPCALPCASSGHLPHNRWHGGVPHLATHPMYFLRPISFISLK